MGFRTRKYRVWDRSDKEHPRIVGVSGNQPLTVKQLQRYVKQTEYAGIIYEKWTNGKAIKARWDGIVSVDMFNKANRGQRFIKINADGNNIEIIHNYSSWSKMQRKRDNPKYPWKCILCPVCRAEVLASASRGKLGKKHDAYHCGLMKTGKRSHSYFRVTQKDFEKNVIAYIESLRSDDGFWKGLELHLIDQYNIRKKDIETESSMVNRSVTDLRSEQAKTLDAFKLAETPTTRKILEQQIEDLEKRIADAETHNNQTVVTETSLRSFIKMARSVMEHPAKILIDAADLSSRRRLMSLLFEEPPTYIEIVNGTPKLQPIFRLSEEFKNNKSQLVAKNRTYLELGTQL